MPGRWQSNNRKLRPSRIDELPFDRKQAATAVLSASSSAEGKAMTRCAVRINFAIAGGIQRRRIRFNSIRYWSDQVNMTWWKHSRLSNGKPAPSTTCPCSTTTNYSGQITRVTGIRYEEIQFSLNTTGSRENNVTYCRNWTQPDVTHCRNGTQTESFPNLSRLSNISPPIGRHLSSYQKNNQPLWSANQVACL